VAFHRGIADTLMPLVAQITGWTKAGTPTRRARSAGPRAQNTAFVRDVTGSGDLTIRVKGAEKMRSMEILDSTGRIVKTWTGIRSNAATWKGSDAKPGIFAVIATLESGDRIEGRLVVTGGGR
jgi:hypothetical protein